MSLLGVTAGLVRLAGPIKEQYARDKGLDLNKLMGDGPYKELYRREMVEWSDSFRAKNPDIWTEKAVTNLRASFYPNGPFPAVWIIADTRRKSDVFYFTNKFGSSRCVLVRIEASAETRSRRGFVFVPGVDDAETECGLDPEALGLATAIKFDYTVYNDEHEQSLYNTDQFVCIARNLVLSNIVEPARRASAHAAPNMLAPEIPDIAKSHSTSAAISHYTAAITPLQTLTTYSTSPKTSPAVSPALSTNKSDKEPEKSPENPNQLNGFENRCTDGKSSGLCALLEPLTLTQTDSETSKGNRYFGSGCLRKTENAMTNDSGMANGHSKPADLEMPIPNGHLNGIGLCNGSC